MWLPLRLTLPGPPPPPLLPLPLLDIEHDNNEDRLHRTERD